MKKNKKPSGVLSKIEILLASVLFFTMLFSCGLYINIKMNGEISSLPPLPENEKRQLVRAVASDSFTYADDLLEPVFVGFKNGDDMVCATPDDEIRRTIETTVYDSLYTLFSGKHSRRTFENQNETQKYIDDLKNSDTYMLISFFCDMPAEIFLPCISKNYELSHRQEESFMIKHLFLLPDDNDQLYGVSVSENNDVNVIIPSENINFGKIVSGSYDVNDGYSDFEYLDLPGIYPVLSTSFASNYYKVEPYSALFGIETDSSYTSKLFDIFGINSSLVKSFASGDKSEMNYVYEGNELVLKNDGDVIYRSSEGDGIYLEEILGYFPHDKSGYGYVDKIFAIKNIVNGLRSKNDKISFSLTKIEYDAENGRNTYYLKLFADGVLVTDDEYDACFEFAGDSLNSAYIRFLSVKKIESEKKLLMPQKYAAILSDTEFDVYCAVLSESEKQDVKEIKWAGFSSSVKEVNS